MSSPVVFGNAVGRVRRGLRYAFYDWTREMPRSKRLITWVAILMQGYAIWVGFSRSLIWPLVWPRNGAVLFLSAALLYLLGDRLMNGMLTSEFIRKTQLEADQIAAQQIQKTLHPERMQDVSGYEIEAFYKPYRAVGGDYFDVIDLPNDRMLLAMADVSGKGMAAALLAANIQALVRSLANADGDPVALARQINAHLSRYTPENRFATAVFIALSRGSGEFSYVNAGHNAPLVVCDGATTCLEATGMPMGLQSSAEYEARTGIVPKGGTLLLFTDGLTDSVGGEDPEGRLRKAIAETPAKSLTNIRSLIDPQFNEDDITILVLTRNER
jgi:serine phosphatase RsbU (regulator of sigma subunit)